MAAVETEIRDILHKLSGASTMDRRSAIEELLNFLKVEQGEANQIISGITDPLPIYQSLALALNDPDSQVRKGIVTLLNELLTRDLWPSRLDANMRLVLPHLIPCLGDIICAVRRAATQCLHVYLQRTPDFEHAIQSIVHFGLENGDIALQRECCKALPILLTNDITSKQDFFELVQALVTKLTSQQENLTNAAVRSLTLIQSMVGVDIFRAHIDRLSPAQRQCYFRLCGSLTTSPSRVAGQLALDQSEPLYCGFIPEALRFQLESSDNQRERSMAIEQVKLRFDQVIQRGDTEDILQSLRHLLSFMQYLLQDTNIHVVQNSLEILTTLVENLGKELRAYVRTLVFLLQRSLGDPKRIVQICVMKYAMVLIRYFDADPVISQLCDHLNHKNSRVRHEIVNIVIAALLQFPSSDFKIDVLCRLIAPLLTDRKNLVRVACLECMAVLAHLLGAGRLGPWARAVDSVELSPGGEGVVELVQTRIGCRKLPHLTAQGLVEYAVRPPTPSPSSASTYGRPDSSALEILDLENEGVERRRPSAATRASKSGRGSKLPWDTSKESNEGGGQSTRSVVTISGRQPPTANSVNSSTTSSWMVEDSLEVTTEGQPFSKAPDFFGPRPRNDVSVNDTYSYVIAKPEDVRKVKDLSRPNSQDQPSIQRPTNASGFYLTNQQQQLLSNRKPAVLHDSANQNKSVEPAVSKAPVAKQPPVAKPAPTDSQSKPIPITALQTNKNQLSITNSPKQPPMTPSNQIKPSVASTPGATNKAVSTKEVTVPFNGNTNGDPRGTDQKKPKTLTNPLTVPIKKKDSVPLEKQQVQPEVTKRRSIDATSLLRSSVQPVKPSSYQQIYTDRRRMTIEMEISPKLEETETPIPMKPTMVRSARRNSGTIPPAGVIDQLNQPTKSDGIYNRRNSTDIIAGQKEFEPSQQKPPAPSTSTGPPGCTSQIPKPVPISTALPLEPAVTPDSVMTSSPDLVDTPNDIKEPMKIGSLSSIRRSATRKKALKVFQDAENDSTTSGQTSGKTTPTNMDYPPFDDEMVLSYGGSNQSTVPTHRRQLSDSQYITDSENSLDPCDQSSASKNGRFDYSEVESKSSPTAEDHPPEISHSLKDSLASRKREMEDRRQKELEERAEREEMRRQNLIIRREQDEARRRGMEEAKRRELEEKLARLTEERRLDEESRTLREQLAAEEDQMNGERDTKSASSEGTHSRSSNGDINDDLRPSVRRQLSKPPTAPAESSIRQSRSKSSQNLSKASSGYDSTGTLSVGPLSHPDKTMQDTIPLLARTDWQEKVEALSLLQRLVEHHSELLVGRPADLHQLTLALIRECKNLRSQVSRMAIQTLTTFYSQLKRSCDVDLDHTVLVLLCKAGESSGFIREDVDTALETMINCVTAQKAALSLIHGGAQHKSTNVRRTCAFYLCRACDRMGSAKVLSGAKDVTDKIIPAAAQFTVDGHTETRYYGRKIFFGLMTHQDFERICSKHLTETTWRNLKETVENLKNKGLGKPPNAAPSASITRSSSAGLAISSMAGSGSTPSLESPSPGPTSPYPPSGPPSSTSSSAGSQWRPARQSESVTEQVKTLCGRLSASDFRERHQAVLDLTEWAETSPDAVGQNIVKIFDKFIPRLLDSNSKVSLVAVQNMQRCLRPLRSHLTPVMTLLVQSGSQTLASKNQEIAAAGHALLTALIEEIDGAQLIQPYVQAVTSGNPRVKPEMINHLAVLVARLGPRKPRLVSLHVLPELWRLLQILAPSGDSYYSASAGQIPSSAGGLSQTIRGPTQRLVIELYTLLGDSLIESGRTNLTMTAPMMSMLQDMMRGGVSSAS